MILSFRNVLTDSVRSLLHEIDWKEDELPEVISEILTGLSKHREEGKRLVPSLFMTRDLNQVVQDLGGAAPIRLGAGPLTPETVRRAIKQCAPLGEGRSWVIFIEIAAQELKYGVFRAPTSPVEPTAFERLRRSQCDKPQALGFVQLADSVVEIRGSANFFRYIHLSGAVPGVAAPMQTAKEFIKTLSSNLSEEYREPMNRLYYRLFMDVLQTWHGMLAVVVKDPNRIPRVFEDGVFLNPPLNLSECVESFLNDACYDAGAELQARMNLIRGMLGSDGILLFTDDGRLLAYNVFMKHSGELDLPFQPLGGARRRTFEYLKHLVGHEIKAAFYRSQDGLAKAFTEEMLANQL